MIISHRIYILAGLLLFTACSTKKNTWQSRTYHNVNSEFNVKFNAVESFEEGVKKAENYQVVDYNELLPVFIFVDEGIPGQVTSEMERTIDKCNKLVTKHSITAKPKKSTGTMTQKEREFYNKREYNTLVDDAYLLSAKASLYLHKYDQAITILDYLLIDFPKESAAPEAKIWLAIALSYSGGLERAGGILKEINPLQKMPKSRQALLYAAYANYYIQQKEYVEAIAALNNALIYEKQKNKKIRYHFILANLYQQVQQLGKATTHLEEIIASSHNYEQIFSAQLLLAGSYNPNSGKNLRENLLRMLEDEKNKEFADRIYFALAKIELAQKNTSKAIDYLQKSIDAESNNPRQRGYSYEMLGNHYYTHKEYPKAYEALKLAAQTLGPGYVHYNEIYSKVTLLKKLAENWQIVHREDSLQRIAKLPEDERNKLITKAINAVLEEEQKANEEQQRQQFLIDQQEQAGYSRQSSNSTGKWYFYNTNSVNSGLVSFAARWGKRRLEDNWRRKDRNATPALASDEFATGEESTASSTQFSNKSREYYTQDLPLTPEAMEASNNKTRIALFGLGEAYMNDVNEKQWAIETFKTLISRFPDNEFLASSYYYLYKLCADVGNKIQSEQYKQLLISNYPKEPITQMLVNPKYLQEQQAISQEVEKLYEDAFNFYTQGHYTEALQTLGHINEQYPKNLIQPQIALLRAFTIAKTNTTIAYKQSLTDLISQYPNSEAAKTATGLLASLDANILRYTTPTAPPSAEPQIQSDTTTNVKTAYLPAGENEHYFGILFESRNSNNNLLFTIESYNVDHFLDENYEVSVNELKNGYLMVVVKSFAKRRDAVAYLQALTNDKVLSRFDPAAFRRLLITPENLELLLKTGEVLDYLEFFNTHYVHDVPADH